MPCNVNTNACAPAWPNTGYISHGSVLDRSTLRPPRSGYQWTRKVARKTITVALSPEQFQFLRKAIQNGRNLQKTIGKMERLSRQILFQNPARHPSTQVVVQESFRSYLSAIRV